MKIAILIENNYQVLEVWYPYLRLKEEGFTPIFVGTGKGEYKSKEGYIAKEDLSVENVNYDEFDGVIIPGGYAPDILRTNEKILQFIRRMNEETKLVAAICHAGWVIASADIVRGKKATCFSSIKDDLTNAGAEFIDQKVVVDDNLITSRNPFDLPFFCKEILAFLKNKINPPVELSIGE